MLNGEGASATTAPKCTKVHQSASLLYNPSWIYTDQPTRPNKSARPVIGRIVPATSDATPADMLSRLPVMEPIDWQAEPPSTSTCDAAEPDLKRPKRSEDQRALEVFQEV